MGCSLPTGRTGQAPAEREPARPGNGTAVSASDLRRRTPEAETGIRNAAVSADGPRIVYCLSHDGGYDLHAIDLNLDPPEDAPITNDDRSCSPVF